MEPKDSPTWITRDKICMSCSQILWALAMPSIQTYNIAKSGALTFTGGIMTGTNAGSGLFQAPSLTSSNTFAYAASLFDCCGLPPGWSGYTRQSNGELQNLTFNLSKESLPSGYVPFYVTADPANHVAAIVSLNDCEGCYGPARLASYTVDSLGNLSTTSTAENMPSPAMTSAWTLNMSPSGKLLAVGGYGLQVFHFNGAAPITPYSKLLTPAAINQIHWDNNNHLYALSFAQTSSSLSFSVTGVTQVTLKGSDGSSYPVGNGNCSGGCGGFQRVSPKITTTYSLSGIGANGKKVSASATVTVNSTPSARDASLNPSPDATSALTLSAYPTTLTTYSRLFVYTVTPTTISQAPGSPYVINKPGVNALIVVPK